MFAARVRVPLRIGRRTSSFGISSFSRCFLSSVRDSDTSEDAMTSTDTLHCSNAEKTCDGRYKWD